MGVLGIVLIFLAIVTLFTVAKGSWPNVWKSLTGQTA